jgi:hypothetical protein
MLSPETDSPPAGIPLEQLNNYEYVNADGSGDPKGLRCPIGAHMRRINPRGQRPQILAARSSGSILSLFDCRKFSNPTTSSRTRPERQLCSLQNDCVLVTLHTISPNAMTTYSARLSALLAEGGAFRELWRHDGMALMEMKDGQPVPTFKVHFVTPMASA